MDGAVKARSETFTQPALYAVSGIRGMAEISGQYFRAANELRARAQESAGAKGTSAVRYVFPAVILYCACIESYFNEQLTLSATMVSNDELLTRIEYLKQTASPRERLREVFRLYDPRHMGLDTDGELYRSLGALLCVAVADWSHATSKELIQAFNQMVGRIGTSFDPFESPEAIWRWE